MPLTVQGTLSASDPDLAERIRAALPEHIRLSRAEPGNLHFNITESDDPGVWTVDEAFVDAAAFEAHKARTATSDWPARTDGLSRDLTISESAG